MSWSRRRTRLVVAALRPAVSSYSRYCTSTHPYYLSALATTSTVRVGRQTGRDRLQAIGRSSRDTQACAKLEITNLSWWLSISSNHLISGAARNENGHARAKAEPRRACRGVLTQGAPTFPLASLDRRQREAVSLRRKGEGWEEARDWTRQAPYGPARGLLLLSIEACTTT